MIGRIALGLMILVATARADALPQKTLDECIDFALAQQPRLKAAGSTVEAARERVWQSTAAYLPQVSANYVANRRKATSGSLTGGGGSFGGPPSARTFNFYSTGVALSQVLFDFGQNLALIHRAKALESSAAADAQTEHDAIVFEVTQAYLGLLAAQRLRVVADETVRQNTQHLDLAQGRYEVGFAPRFDVTQASVQLANAELAQVTARNNVTLGRETLRNAMGMSTPLDFDVVDVLSQPLVKLGEDDAVELAYANRPELVSIAAQQKAQALQIDAITKDYLPKITGNANYTWSGSQYPLQDTWNIGAAVNLSVFNGGLTTAQVGEARANLATLEANAETLRQNVQLEVRQAMANVREGAEAIRVTEKARRQARENVELAEGRYSTGVGSIIELTDAQASLASAEANLVQSLVNYRVAIATLERAVATSVTKS
jgi:outer membrane protein TolC